MDVVVKDQADNASVAGSTGTATVVAAAVAEANSGILLLLLYYYYENNYFHTYFFFPLLYFCSVLLHCSARALQIPRDFNFVVLFLVWVLFL